MAIKTLMIGLVVALTLGTTDAQRCKNETTGECIDCVADCADYDIVHCETLSMYTVYMNVFCQKTCDSCPGGPAAQPEAKESGVQNSEGSMGMGSMGMGSQESGMGGGMGGGMGAQQSSNDESGMGMGMGMGHKAGKMSLDGLTLFETNSESQSPTSTLVSIGAGCVLLAGVAGVAYKYKNRLGYSAVEQTEDSKVPNIII